MSTLERRLVMKRVLWWRWSFYTVGMIVMSLGIAMTIKGYKLGVGPWDVLHIGLQQKFGLTIGSWSIITGLAIVIVTSIVMKKLPQIGTWLNMILMGVFIDFFNWLLPTVETFPVQMIIFISGVIVMSYGIGIYMAPNIGAGPRDSLMLIFIRKFNVSIKVIRTTLEVIVAILGWMLGGPIGIGTIIIALFIGQIVQYTLPRSQNILLKIIGENYRKALT